MYPRLLIHRQKLIANLDAVAAITKEQGGCSLMIVTKGMCAHPALTQLIAAHPAVDFMADSRVANIKTYADLAHQHGKQTVLLRIPMHAEVEEMVRYVDLSFQSELSTLRLTDEAAGRLGIRHKVLLMIDLGDLREGIFYRDEDAILHTVQQVLTMKNLELFGIGVNLTCYGAIIPKPDNLGQLVDIAHRLETHFGITLSMVSGGNSSSIYLIQRGELPAGINNLRLGEAFLLGNDTAYGSRLPGTTGDGLILEAQIVELKEKPSLPIGEVGVDAFGQKPYYEDRGIIQRAIIAVGKQDTDIDSMFPLDPDIDILGGSSDHIILDVTRTGRPYQVGDVLSFTLGYGGMLKAATSPYVEKVVL